MATGPDSNAKVATSAAENRRAATPDRRSEDLLVMMSGEFQPRR